MSHEAEELLEGIRVLLRVFTVEEDRFPPAEGRVKYNAIDFQALHFIEQNAGCLTSELARFLTVSPTTAQSVCDRLVRRGFVNRRKHPSDRRAVSLSLSEEGRSVAASIKRQDLANCQLMLGGLPEEERAEFAARVRTIARSLSGETKA